MPSSVTSSVNPRDSMTTPETCPIPQSTAAETNPISHPESLGGFSASGWSSEETREKWNLSWGRDFLTAVKFCHYFGGGEGVSLIFSCLRYNTFSQRKRLLMNMTDRVSRYRTWKPVKRQVGMSNMTEMWTTREECATIIHFTNLYEFMENRIFDCFPGSTLRFSSMLL